MHDGVGCLCCAQLNTVRDGRHMGDLKAERPAASCKSNSRMTHIRTTNIHQIEAKGQCVRMIKSVSFKNSIDPELQSRVRKILVRGITYWLPGPNGARNVSRKIMC